MKFKYNFYFFREIFRHLNGQTQTEIIKNWKHFSKYHLPYLLCSLMQVL